MLKRFIARWRATAERVPATARGGAAADGARPFAAVTVIPGPVCCEAVRALGKRRILAREAPRLPLSACERPDACGCTYRKFADRREKSAEDRRIGRAPPRGPTAEGRDQRLGAGRRSTDE